MPEQSTARPWIVPPLPELAVPDPMARWDGIPLAELDDDELDAARQEAAAGSDPSAPPPTAESPVAATMPRATVTPTPAPAGEPRAGSRRTSGSAANELSEAPPD